MRWHAVHRKCWCGCVFVRAHLFSRTGEQGSHDSHPSLTPDSNSFVHDVHIRCTLSLTPPLSATQQVFPPFSSHSAAMLVVGSIQ